MTVQQQLYILRLGLRDLGRAKLRSSLTLLGVLFGVSSVIVMLAVGEGAKADAVRQLEELGSNNIILKSTKPTRESAQDAEGAVFRYGLTPDDLETAMTVPTIRQAAKVREHRREIRRADRMAEGRVLAVTPEYRELKHIEVERGRFLNDLDEKRSSTVAVLSADLAALLFPIEEPLGGSIRIGMDHYYEVIGVTARSSRQVERAGRDSPQDIERDLYIPFSTDRKLFGQFLTYLRAGNVEQEGLEISEITLTVDTVENVKRTSREVVDLMSRFHHRQDFQLIVPLDLLEKVEETQKLFSLVLGAIASISLLVGGIGIMNIMLATVSERTREIGIRRALGARRGDILRQFLLETVLLSGSGGVLGVILGLAASYSLTLLVGMEAIVRPTALFLAFTISITIGLVFGTYPARRASLMNPIDALRHE